MRRGILPVSLCLLFFPLFIADAVPWREKNALREASALPKRLIDSIMAQGNWNLLFQQGPFNEFQRQIAIAVHFALRGETPEAEIYFKRAQTALQIAYASLRSQFGWPRSPTQLRAEALPWGENRDTFRDYLLCQLQLYIERGLASHDTGRIDLEKLQETVAQTEHQLGVELAQKDPDLARFVRLLQGSLALRTKGNSSNGERAAQFRELNANLPPSVKNYWRRRALLFQIQENLYHGHLAMARALTEFYHSRQGGDLDHLAVARFYIQASDFSAAMSLLESAFARTEMRSSENYPDLIRTSEMLQNVLIWQKKYERAAEVATDSRELLNSLIASNLVPREEFVAIRRSAANQKLRSEMLRFIASGQCPSVVEPTEGSEPELEWRIRERFFYEQCGLARQSGEWEKLLSDKSLGPEAGQIIRFGLGLPVQRKLQAAKNALQEFLILYSSANLKTPGAKQRSDAIRLLDVAGHLQADLLFLDWGIALPSDVTEKALNGLKGNLSGTEANAVFAALHRKYLRSFLRGRQLMHFAATDAAELRSDLHDWILGGDSELRTSPPASFDGELLYADDERVIHYAPEINRKLRIYRKTMPALGAAKTIDPQSPGKKIRLFGKAAALVPEMVWQAKSVEIAPFHGTCAGCQVSARTPARLLLGNLRENGWKSTRADLGDIFSAQLNITQKAECNFSKETYLDTLILHSEEEQVEYPCNFALENLVLETAPTAMTIPLDLLVAAAGRVNSATILLPRDMNAAARTAFLFDFLQRRNRQDAAARRAFEEARRRAEKSFPPGSGIEQLRIYAVAD